MHAIPSVITAGTQQELQSRYPVFRQAFKLGRLRRYRPKSQTLIAQIVADVTTLLVADVTALLLVVTDVIAQTVADVITLLITGVTPRLATDVTTQ